MGRRRRRKERERRTALQSMVELLSKAEQETFRDADSSRDMVRRALRLQQHHRLRLPEYFKHKICPNCKCIIRSGYTATHRTRSEREPHLAITCHTCRHIIRLPLKPPKKGFKVAQAREAELSVRPRWFPYEIRLRKAS